jgi:hypothetical protein
LLLSYFLQQCAEGKLTQTEAINKSSKALYEIRNPRVSFIVKRAAQIASSKTNHSVFAEFGMYFFLWLVGTFPTFGKLITPVSCAPQLMVSGKLILGDQNEILNNWEAQKEVQHIIEKEESSIQ